METQFEIKLIDMLHWLYVFKSMRQRNGLLPSTLKKEKLSPASILFYQSVHLKTSSSSAYRHIHSRNSKIAIGLSNNDCMNGILHNDW